VGWQDSQPLLSFAQDFRGIVYPMRNEQNGYIKILTVSGLFVKNMGKNEPGKYQGEKKKQKEKQKNFF
jgi:hypothetical protein